MQPPCNKQRRNRWSKQPRKHRIWWCQTMDTHKGPNSPLQNLQWWHDSSIKARRRKFYWGRTQSRFAVLEPEGITLKQLLRHFQTYRRGLFSWWRNLGEREVWLKIPARKGRKIKQCVICKHWLDDPVSNEREDIGEWKGDAGTPQEPKERWM